MVNRTHIIIIVKSIVAIFLLGLFAYEIYLGAIDKSAILPATIAIIIAIYIAWRQEYQLKKLKL